MDRWTIRCESCERSWTIAATFSFYEQQSVESHPCPHCAAYTLACSDPARDRSPGKLRANRRPNPVAA